MITIGSAVARVTVFAAAMAVAGPVCAGPDATTQWLIHDPLTVMDYGIMKINSSISPLGGYAQFHYDENRIVIARYADGGSQADVEASCSKWIADIRGTAFLNSETGQPYGDASGFAQMFSHEGFQMVSEPKDLFKSIDAILALQCLGAYQDADGKKGYLTITSPLLGTGYSVKKS